MNVLVLICTGGWMSSNLSGGWRRLGAHVEEFFYGTHMGKSWTREGLATARDVNATLLSHARALKAEGRLDLIFAVIYDDVLDVDTAKQLCRLNVPMVNYHLDLVGQWYRVLRSGRYFDLVACAQRDHWEGLRRAGIRPYFMPMAANPPEPGDDRAVKYDGVLYLGSPAPFRIHVLKRLLASGVGLRILGNNWLQANARADVSRQRFARKTLHDIRHYLWPRVRQEGSDLFWSVAPRLLGGPGSEGASALAGVIQGRYSDSDFASLVRGAAINLGFTHFRGRTGSRHERRQTRLRDFEIPMSGGFYLAQSCEEMEELYRPGEHLVTWNDEADLLEKIRYYAARPEERCAIARSGQRYALEHHTWANRFTGLLRELGMPLPN